MIIKLLVDGGAMKPGPIVGQQLGPAGINIGEVISKVNEATSNFKGMKVPIILDVDTKSKEFSIEVSSPPTSELLKKEIGLEKGSGDHKKEKVANIGIEQAIKVAKTKHPNMLARDFKSAVKSVVGSCASIGILVENKEAVELEQDIASGKFDKEIQEQKIEISPDKKTKLKAYFDKVVKEQKAVAAAEEAAKAEEEAAKAKAAEGAEEAPEEGAEGAEAAETAPAEEKKEESPAEEKK